jgi:serine/threonine protein kinase
LSYARKECIIHSQLKHENIVELYDYTENEKEIVLLMEFCNDASYFEEKIENVSQSSILNIIVKYLMILEILGNSGRITQYPFEFNADVTLILI